MSGPLDISPVIDAAVSHAQTTGLFDRVNGAEPKSPPGSGITGACWLQGLRPAVHGSGLASSSMVLDLQFRVYTSMFAEDPELIDPNLANAATALFANLCGDFGLDSLVRCVDLLGIEGQPLRGQAGYLKIGEKLYRVFDIWIPLIMNDVFDQVE